MYNGRKKGGGRMEERIAKEFDYAAVERLPDWNGCKVYAPVETGAFRAVGLPEFVLVNGGSFRRATADEVYSILENLES